MANVEHTFSVVINTTDRARSLQTLLRTLEHQSYPHFEVIVVVGPTNDNTLEILKDYEDRLRVLHCPVANLSVSRNIGLRAARGDIVAYIDDDAVPSRNWLLQLNRLFANPLIAATGGVVYLIHPTQPTVQHKQGIISALAEQYDVRASLLDKLPPEGLGRFWTMRMMGANMAYRRSALLSIGGFDEFYEWVYDDADVAIRLAAAGFLVHPVSEAPVYHVPASSRNREVFTFHGRWWIQTKAAVYFTIKNGKAVGVPSRDILRRIGYFVHGHWLWNLQLFQQKKISLKQLLKASVLEVRGAIVGATKALFFAQSPSTKEDLQEPLNSMNASIQPFLNESSATQTAIDPVSGRQPLIQLSNSPLRIALLSFNYPPERYEGVGRSTNMLAKGLFELGHTVHVLTHGNREAVSFYDGAYVHRVPYRLNRYMQFRHLPKVHHVLNYSHAVHERLQRLLLNDDIQIVDTPLWLTDGFVTAVSGMLPVVVRPVTAQRQIAELQHHRDDDLRLMGEIEEELLRHAQFIVANTQATVRALDQVYHVLNKTNSVQVIHYGIEPAADEATRPFPLDYPPTKFTVLYVGRLEKRKGIQDLFTAIPKVLRRFPQAEFVIAGADNSESDGFKRKTGLSYPAYFQKRHSKYAAKVRFLGEVSEEKLQALYQSCHLFVAPSLYESFGLIYLEAMNYAKPVIGCRAGGIPEVVDDGVTGRLVDPESPEQLAEAIVELLQSPRTLYEYGLAGRQRLLDRFTYIHMARGFEQIYRRVLAEIAARS
ncbi:glycosyltransferase [Litorilinea aerophila]|uniref:Glycosyltransferase n=1 Tax=Litorilinea aerophila TaxID=1204385 RepID=A0A540VJ87_9CHLR|nr:glycosyltransferase [Litorilinea aerophila]MCC9075703.1 glycosyltransferase [Litorilinea aerophila]